MESSKACYFTPVMRLCQLAGMENFDLSKIGLVEDVLCDANEDKVRNIICATRRLGAYGSLRGKLFESLVHETLCARGDFLVRDLDVGSEPFQTSFPK